MDNAGHEDYLKKADRLFGRLGLWMYSHKLVVLATALGLLFGGLYFAAQTRTDNSFDSFFDATDPAYSAYMTYQDEFGSDEVAYILYSVPGSSYGPFELDTMQRIVELTQVLEDEVPFVKDVTSLSNVEFITADGDFLEIHELALDMPEDQATLLQRRNAMMQKPSYRGSLVNDEATHGAIILEMTVTSSDPLESLRLDPDAGDSLANLYPQAANNKIVEILGRPQYQGIDFRWAGDVPMNAAYNDTIGDESTLQTLLSLALVSILALVCFRFQLLGLVGPLTVVILALIMTVGFMGLVGYKIGVLFLIAPTLLIAIGVAQSVHLIATFNLLRDRGLDRREAVKQTLEHVAMPCLLAAFTTAIGFSVMAGSHLRALAEMAIYLGVGVMLTYFASITVMVCYMSMGSDAHRRLRDPSEEKPGILDRFLLRVVAINLKRPLAIIAIFGAVLAASIAGLSKLQVGFNFLEEFKPHTRFFQHTHYVQDVMGGVLNIVLIYDSGEADGIKRARILSHLDELRAYAEQSPLVEKSYSVVDILKDLNQSFHGDDPAYYRLPESNELIAQYLLMYEISGGEDLEDFLSGDYRQTTLELRVEITDSTRIEGLIRDLDRYIDEHPLSGVNIQITGIGLLWIKMAEYIAQSQLWGYLLAFSIIALVLCLAFRSIKVGLLAMIPNLFPVILVLGLLGWQEAHLDYFRLLLATVAIGIAVDDTVHITSRIRKEFLRCGNYTEAIRVSLTSVGRALVMTTIILSLSFLVFLMSEMAVVADFGILLSLTMVTALLADLFLLPALVLVLKPFGAERHTGETANPLQTVTAPAN
jgi:predicted RND superfamily exporter protein